MFHSIVSISDYTQTFVRIIVQNILSNKLYGTDQPLTQQNETSSAATYTLIK